MAERNRIVERPQPDRRDSQLPPAEKKEERRGIRDYVRESYDQLPVPEIPKNPKDDD